MQIRRERDQLQQSLEAAKAELRAKVGEVTIVRANQAQYKKELERRVVANEKRMEAEVAKTQEELTKITLERDSLRTESVFHKADVRDEVQQSKLSRRAVKPPGDGGAAASKNAAAIPITTPKKHHKALSYRDGFDDDEIMVISPSKGGARSKAGTPKAGGKRKRKGIDDSPIPALQLSQSSMPIVAREESQNTVVSNHEQVLQKFGGIDIRYEVRPVRICFVGD